MRRLDLDLEAEKRRLKVIEEEQRRPATLEARRASMVQAVSPDWLRASSPGRPALARTKSFTPDFHWPEEL